MKTIPYGHQNISENDINAVIDVLRSDWLTQGPAVEKFEKAIANYCNVQHGVAVCNATAALHLACLALDVGKGDYVWTSPNTFLASANCALYCEANIDFVDIDSKTYNLSVIHLRKKLEQAAKENKLPKVVIPVHFAGQSCDMKAIKELADKYKFHIVEDASHAIGGKYCEHKIGDCTYSDMTIFSFHPVKIITTGEGGMIMTNNKNLAEKLKLLRSHGMTRNQVKSTGNGFKARQEVDDLSPDQAKHVNKNSLKINMLPGDNIGIHSNQELMVNESHGAWYYQQIALGYNYRVTDIQCALGLSQFQRIDEFVQIRHKLAERYDQMLKTLPLILPYQEPYNYSAFHLYVVQLKLDQIKKTRKEVFDELRTAGIGVAVHYIPVHLQPYYKQFGFKEGDFSEAERYYSAALTLPLYPGLTIIEQKLITDAIDRILI